MLFNSPAKGLIPAIGSPCWDHRFKICCIVLILLVGCASTTDPDIDQYEPIFELPEGWHQEDLTGETFDEGWCADFGDAELGRLIEMVWEQNFNIHIAETRVAQARALLKQGRSQRHPQVGLEAFAGSIFQSLWDGGRRQGEIDEQEAIKERQLLEFSSVLLDAIREVEDTLARGQALYEMLQYQRLQLNSAEEALELAREQ